MTVISRVTEALLLAAGLGTRLQPLTLDSPKCFTMVGGIPIIERLLNNLREQGIGRLIVVIGYMGSLIQNFLQQSARDFQVDYIVNPDYKTTNNIYSLWLARHLVKGPFLLVESDLIFESWMLQNMLQPNKIAISKIRPRMNGTTVELGFGSKIKTIHVGNENFISSRYKTVNLYSLSLQSWRKVEKVLGRFILEGRVNEYYEAVFAKMVGDGTLSFDPVFFHSANWHEIDTKTDLEEAERKFARRRARSDLLPQPASEVLSSG